MFLKPEWPSRLGATFFLDRTFSDDKTIDSMTNTAVLLITDWFPRGERSGEQSHIDHIFINLGGRKFRGPNREIVPSRRASLDVGTHVRFPQTVRWIFDSFTLSQRSQFDHDRAFHLSAILDFGGSIFRPVKLSLTHWNGG